MTHTTLIIDDTHHTLMSTHLAQRGRVPVYLVGQDGLPHLLQRAVAHVVPERELACKGQGQQCEGAQAEQAEWQR